MDEPIPEGARGGMPPAAMPGIPVGRGGTVEPMDPIPGAPGVAAEDGAGGKGDLLDVGG